MKIENNKFVGITYDLHTLEGNTPVETVEATEPLTFIVGKGMLLPKFEENLLNLKDSDTFEFTLKSEDAYGTYDLEAVFDLPMNIFMSGGKPREDLLVVGNVLPIRDNSGRVMNGKIMNIGKESVKMDFNHPLAGKDLVFKGKVVEIRESTDDDMQQFFSPQGGCEGCSSDECGPGCG